MASVAEEEVAQGDFQAYLVDVRLRTSSMNGGQSARLVEAQDVHGSSIDRARALDERLAAGEADDGQGVGDGDHHDQALGHERD